MPCSLPRGTSGVRAQGMAGIAEPYFALIACTTCLAMITCVALLACTPSHENASPNGLAEHGFGCPSAFVNAGNGATCVGIARSESRVGLGLSHAQPRCAAMVESAALYAKTAPTSFRSSAGTTIAATVSAQSRLVA